MTGSSKVFLPWWLVAFIVIEILPMFLGPVAALSLPGFMGGPGAETITQAAYIYTARNVAVGIALIIALALRNGPMLFILILVRLLTDLVDLPTILAFGLVRIPALTIGIFVFFYYLPAIFALRYLWKRIDPGTAQADDADGGI